MEGIAGLFLGLFVGMGLFLVLAIWAYYWYQLTRSLTIGIDTDEKYEQAEQIAVTKYALKHGLDINKMVLQNNMKTGRRFKKLIEQKMIEDMFPEEKETKGDKK